MRCRSLFQSLNLLTLVGDLFHCESALCFVTALLWASIAAITIVSLSLARQASKTNDSSSQFSNDPNSLQIVTHDIDNFWRAYDLAGANNAVEVFQEEYINKGSIGLRDFVQLRIESAAELANWVARHPLYYSSIRASTARVSSFAPQIRQTFSHLKSIYPEAVFPNVYFVIGRMTSGGTTSYNGLLHFEQKGPDPQTLLGQAKWTAFPRDAEQRAWR